MKRDMDLIRRILLSTESEDLDSIQDVDGKTLAFHVALLEEAGLLKAYLSYDGADLPVGFVIRRITWSGYEFLESVRDKTIWEKAKKYILKPGASWTFVILAEYLKGEIKERLGMG
jgi:hypothetical protein